MIQQQDLPHSIQNITVIDFKASLVLRTEHIYKLQLKSHRKYRSATISIHELLLWFWQNVKCLRCPSPTCNPHQNSISFSPPRSLPLETRLFQQLDEIIGKCFVKRSSVSTNPTPRIALFVRPSVTKFRQHHIFGPLLKQIYVFWQLLPSVF